MDLRLVCKAGVERYESAELPQFLGWDDGVVWVEIPVCDTAVLAALGAIWLGAKWP